MKQEVAHAAALHAGGPWRQLGASFPRGDDGALAQISKGVSVREQLSLAHFLRGEPQRPALSPDGEPQLLKQSQYRVSPAGSLAHILQNFVHVQIWRRFPAIRLAEGSRTMNQSIHSFQDVHVHATSVRDWNQTYSQITPGSLESSLMQLTSDRCHLFRERINQRVVQHGEAPKGKVCFAIPLAIPGTLRMQGREADDNSIFFLRGGEEFMFHMPMGMDMLSITFERDLFEAALASTPAAGEIDTLLRQPVIKVPPRRFVECRQRLLALFSEAFAPEDPLETPARERELEQSVLDELLRLMTDPACDRRQRTIGSTHSFIVEKCHRLAMSEAIDVLSVIDLCQRLQISRRTVQNSFRSVAETTPVNYLRSVRLNGVRRALTSTRSCELSIGEAASRWGFFHLSHFAAEYQDLFGELPSQTKRAGKLWVYDA